MSKTTEESVLAQKQSQTSEPRGKWYLVYICLNTWKASIEEKEIPLKATTEAEAIAEGSTKWKEVFAAEWKRHEAANMLPEGDTAFYGVEPHPRIVYKISL